ncbi:MAG TPA: sugar phosphate nucleotidyltransferase [Solirubrobacterales bacterium]|jgi:glucose-1-phosphate thymidylyltransferase
MNKFKGLILAEDAYGPARRELLGRAPQLFPLANTPMLFYALETIRNASIDEVIIAAGPAASEDLRRAVGDGAEWDLSVSFLEDDDVLGPAHAVGLAETLVGESPLLVFDGGTLVTQPIQPFVDRFVEAGLDALTLVGTRNGVASGRPDLAGLGTCILGPRIFDAAAAVAGWGTGQDDLQAAVSWLMASGGRVETHRVDGWWKNTGRPEDLLEANRILLDRLVDSVSAVNGRNAQVEGRVLIDDTATIESSRVRGPSVIGPGARIVDSYVGPYTSVGEEAIIENSEVENAIILPRATIEHFGLRVEESVIGEGAELRRTFRVPRGVSLSIGAEAEIALS